MEGRDTGVDVGAFIASLVVPVIFVGADGLTARVSGVYGGSTIATDGVGVVSSTGIFPVIVKSIEAATTPTVLKPHQARCLPFPRRSAGMGFLICRAIACATKSVGGVIGSQTAAS
jgi:hypothetical protein